MENIPRRILPMLRQGGASEADLRQMLVLNPIRLLEPSPRGARTAPAGPLPGAEDRTREDAHDRAVVDG
jgi:hypothetical protein